MSATRLIEPAAGQEVGFGMQRKLLSSQTCGALCVAEAVLPASTFVPPHVHSREDEITRVLAGRVHFFVGGESFVAEAGAYVLKPRHVVHAFWNSGPEPATVIELVTPGTLDDYFAELFALATERELSEAVRRAAIDEHQRRYGVTFDLELAAALAEQHGLRAPAAAD